MENESTGEIEILENELVVVYSRSACVVRCPIWNESMTDQDAHFVWTAVTMDSASIQGNTDWDISTVTMEQVRFEIAPIPDVTVE